MPPEGLRALGAPRTRGRPEDPAHRAGPSGRHPRLPAGVLALVVAGLVAGILAAALGGCSAVGPTFHEPAADAPDRWPERSLPGPADTGLASVPVVESDPDPRWWQSFHDATLDQLIERAASGNLDLQAATLRIVSSRANEIAARAQGLPNLKATGSYTREQLGARGLIEEQGSSLGTVGQSAEARSIIKQIEQPVSLFQAGFDASWELDLFGRVRRGVEAAEAQTTSALENRRDAQVSLEAEIARNYLEFRGAQALRALSEDEIVAAREILELSESRNRFGLASQSDVEAARASLSTARALMPQYDSQIAQAQDALAVLTGQAPGALDALLAAPGSLPAAPAQIPIGLPASLARRRPDIRQAEANLRAATAQTGVAVAEMFPDISLSVTGGFRSSKLRYLDHWANTFWSVVPGVSLPIFDGGALEANVNMARAAEGVALIGYRKAVLLALQDVDGALNAFQSDQKRRDALALSVAAHRRALDLAEDAYRHGLVSFINVLNALQQLNQDQQQFAQLRVQADLDLVALYKALGGGWQDTSETPEAALVPAAGARTRSAPALPQ